MAKKPVQPASAPANPDACLTPSASLTDAIACYRAAQRELSDEESRRDEALVDMGVAIYAIAAANFADVFAKIAFHRDHRVMDDIDALEVIEADVRSLAGREMR